MGLQIWLPLNGSFENKGLTNTKLTTSSGSWSTISKIGSKSFTGGTITMDAQTTGSIYNNKEVSIAFWFYANAADGTQTGNCIIGNAGMSGTNNRKFSIFNYQTVNDLHWSWQVDGSDSSNGAVEVGGSLTDIFPSYQWTHVCFTYKNPNMCVYINGELRATRTGDVSSSSFEYSTPILNLNASQCVNDLRIYDHCCSAREVSEIAKGLIAHYPLHGNYNSMPNILLESNIEVSNNDYNTHIYVTEAPPVAGEVYTLTMCVTPGQGVTHYSPYLSAGYRNMGNMAVSGTETQIITKTFTASYYTDRLPTDNPAYGHIYIYRFPNDTTQVTSNSTIHWIKLEKGNKSTAYRINNSEDPIGNLVYDCSGYENNATYHGTVSFDNDSPRYDCCTVFSGAQAIKCGRGPMVTDAITVNLWGYLDNWANFNNNIRIMSCTEGGGWNFENIGYFICYAGGGYRNALGDFTSASPGWHMITGTWDGYQSKVYLDGVLKASSTALTTKTPISYNANNNIYIGAEASHTADPTSPYFTGKISDVRIYATALSADDILNLYKVSASISDTGQVFCYGVKEV